MNSVWSIGLPKGSRTLVGKIQTNHVLPSDMESSRGVSEVLYVVGTVGICGALSSRVFSSAVL